MTIPSSDTFVSWSKMCSRTDDIVIIPQKNQKSIGFHKKAPYGELFRCTMHIDDFIEYAGEVGTNEENQLQNSYFQNDIAKMKELNA